MRLFSITFFLMGILCCSVEGQQIRLDSSSTPDRPVYTVVQQHPEFPGGIRQLGEYMKKNLHYPSSLAAEPEGQGRVFVAFIVSEDGRIEDAKVLKGIGPAFDEEALRLVRNMPNWIPAKQDGKVVACRYNLPIHFDSRRAR